MEALKQTVKIRRGPFPHRVSVGCASCGFFDFRVAVSRARLRRLVVTEEIASPNLARRPNGRQSSTVDLLQKGLPLAKVNVGLQR